MTPIITRVIFLYYGSSKSVANFGLKYQYLRNFIFVKIRKKCVTWHHIKRGLLYKTNASIKMFSESGYFVDLPFRRPTKLAPI